MAGGSELKGEGGWGREPVWGPGHPERCVAVRGQQHQMNWVKGQILTLTQKRREKSTKQDRKEHPPKRQRKIKKTTTQILTRTEDRRNICFKYSIQRRFVL